MDAAPEPTLEARPGRADGLLAAAAAVFVLAGGVVHLREWLDTYRHVPDAAPGAFVVRIGFPVNFGLSVVVALALLAAIRVARLRGPAWAAAVALQAGSLAAVVLSREASLLGWSETAWTAAAKQCLVLEIGALVDLAALAGLAALRRRGPQHEPMVVLA